MKAKRALKEQSIEFEEVEAGSQLELLNKIKQTTGKRTVPQVCKRGKAGRLVGAHSKRHPGAATHIYTCC